MLLVSDANIFIDLEKIGLLIEFAKLNIEISTSDFVFNELNEKQQIIVKSLNIEIYTLNSDELMSFFLVPKFNLGTREMRNRKTRTFLLNAYQSYLFNGWLSKRIELSILLESFSEDEVASLMKLPQDSLKGIKKQPHFFKLLDGNLMMHYPFGSRIKKEFYL